MGTLSFFSPTGAANCSEAIGVSVPPLDKLTDRDFRPRPLSVTAISSVPLPMTSASGVTSTCGASDSKRGQRR
jgi:hypothetical protein